MYSVNHAWAVLRGRRMGNREKASSFLESLSPAQAVERNRQEMVAKNIRSRRPYKMGARLKLREIR